MLINLGTFLISSHLGRVAEQGVANTAGLATLRHGTNVISWISIHILGTIPAFGGNPAGGDVPELYNQNVGRTYFSYAYPGEIDNLAELPFPYIRKRALISTKITPKVYQIQSNYNLLRLLKVSKIISIPISIVLTITMPSVKVHLPEENVKNSNDFEKDYTEWYARSTRKWICPLNMGAIGSIWNSLTFKTLQRIRSNPTRVLTGIAQLSFCYFAMRSISAHNPLFIQTHRTSIIAGLVLGLI